MEAPEHARGPPIDFRQYRIRPVAERGGGFPDARTDDRCDVRIVAQRIRHRRSGNARVPGEVCKGDAGRVHLNDSEKPPLRRLSRRE